VAFIVNDRVDLALAVDADGVHVGSSDTAPAVARSLIGRERLLGVSVSGAGLAVDPDAGDPDYLGVGPVFEARTTKPDAAGPGGLALVRRVAVWTQRPIVAIGGITESNAASVIQAGAGCVAVISAVVGAEDIAAATRRLRALVAAARATDP
jgi:thiamine-phosphate pyrophosphorylase